MSRHVSSVVRIRKPQRGETESIDALRGTPPLQAGSQQQSELLLPRAAPLIAMVNRVGYDIFRRSSSRGQKSCLECPHVDGYVTHVPSCTLISHRKPASVLYLRQVSAQKRQDEGTDIGGISRYAGARWYGNVLCGRTSGQSAARLSSPQKRNRLG